MAKFDAGRLTDAAVPELAIAAVIAIGNLATRAMDAKAGRVKALMQWNTWYHGLVMVAGAYMVGTGTKESTGKTMMIADVVPITDRLAAPAIEQAVGVRMRGGGPSQAEIQAQQRQIEQFARSQQRTGYKWNKIPVPHLT